MNYIGNESRGRVVRARSPRPIPPPRGVASRTTPTQDADLWATGTAAVRRRYQTAVYRAKIRVCENIKNLVL